jgi:hypothetical protein
MNTEPRYVAPLAKFCQGVTTQQEAHKLALKRMRRRIKQLSIVLKNRKYSTWNWDETPDQFTETLIDWRRDLKSAISNLKDYSAPYENPPIPAPSHFKTAEDAKKWFAIDAEDYNWWLSQLVGNP